MVVEKIVGTFVAVLVGGSLLGPTIATVLNAGQNIEDPTTKTIIASTGTIVGVGFLVLIAKAMGLF